MGAGRRVQTFNQNGIAFFSINQAAGNTDFRNLRKNNLGGIIFGCTNSTIKECLFKQLFGLPASHISYVSNIDPGLPLFLFNYSDRKLHGIFESASSGRLNINPYGWTADGSGRTLYPAQVQVYLRLQCQELHEDQFKPIIIDNYYSQTHFWFELDYAQTNKLMSLLSSLAVAPSTSLPQNVAKWRNLFNDMPLAHKEEGTEVNETDSDVDFYQLYKSNADMLLPTSDAVPGFSCNSQPSEPHFKKRTVPEDKKEYILMKLKEMTLAREHSDSSLKQSVEDTAVVNDVRVEQSSILKEQEILREKAEPVTSLEYSDVITQLMKQLEELEAFKGEQLQKTEQLEHKLVEAQTEIQQLKQQYITLECRLDHCIEPVKEGMVEFSTEPPLDLDELIFLVGGYNGKTYLSSLDAYLPSQNKMKPLMPMSVVRSLSSVAMLNGELYAFGGGDGSEWYTTVESYNPADNKWIPRPSLTGQPKGSLAGATLENKIFAIGGGNGRESFSEVEMLDSDVGRWIMTQSMLEKRFALAAAELNGAIYAVGGSDGQYYLKSAERFDSREHSWTRIQSMNTKRAFHALTVMNEKLYVLGGFDGNSMLSSVEIFDPRNGSWMTGEAMNIHRGYSAAAVLNESLYVIGGTIDGDTITDTVECYKEDSGWEVTHQGSMACRCFASAIVL
ncbi:DCD domain-containing protein [Heracleum sosnowskyi]|uniref:DCD domain-containing protein n=1 Tax=Heracleum sosnowskyi TaxID=360622 RepID=A0AAD8HEE7_9APIA|nr:DCD domain-containing protein [Heracleum sosnowskyi]